MTSLLLHSLTKNLTTLILSRVLGPMPSRPILSLTIYIKNTLLILQIVVAQIASLSLLFVTAYITPRTNDISATSFFNKKLTPLILSIVLGQMASTILPFQTKLDSIYIINSSKTNDVHPTSFSDHLYYQKF